MNTVILNGIDGNRPTAERIHAVLVDELAGASWTVTSFALRKLNIAPCLGCFECWTRTPGICRLDDDGREIAKSVICSDVLILVTPITFGGYSAALKKALDRMLSLITPFFVRIDGEVHHRKRYQQYPRLLGIGILEHPDPDSERIFNRLVHRNALNLHSPAHQAAVLHTGRTMHEHRETVQWLRTTMETVN